MRSRMTDAIQLRFLIFFLLFTFRHRSLLSKHLVPINSRGIKTKTPAQLGRESKDHAVPPRLSFFDIDRSKTYLFGPITGSTVHHTGFAKAAYFSGLHSQVVFTNPRLRRLSVSVLRSLLATCWLLVLVNVSVILLMKDYSTNKKEFKMRRD
jgi:hypothetical protein